MPGQGPAPRSEPQLPTRNSLEMAERTKYQQQVIRNYYRNQDSILLARLSDLVGELYLAEGKARARHWKAAAEAMTKLQIPASRIEHLVKQDNAALLAKVVEELNARPAAG